MIPRGQVYLLSLFNTINGSRKLFQPLTKLNTPTAQVTEQLGGVSFIYAVGNDDTQKLTVQYEGHVHLATGATVEIGIEPNSALAFDAEGVRI
jgi:hypothetical protein